MRILISAFSFSPYKGSEAEVGWSISRSLARYHDVTVLTGSVRDDCCADYDKYVKESGKVPGLNVVFVKPSKWVKFLDRAHNLPGLWALYYAAYRSWQKLALKEAERLDSEKPFDVVHQLNMTGYREPGFLWKMNRPFVWGPVGGASNEPVSYLPMYPVSAYPAVFIRNLVNYLQKHLLPRPRRAARRAKALWGVTPADLSMIRNVWHCSCAQLTESSAVPSNNVKYRSWDGTSPLRLTWSGIHAYGKALPILLHALTLLKKKRVGFKCHIDILGAGSMTKAWKKLAARLGVDEFLEWHGFIPMDKALAIMNESHAFVFTSVKEGTPHVVLEALAMGLPVLCHDACGMGMAVAQACGIKVPMLSPDGSVSGFASAIETILDNPTLIAQMSKGAVARASELTVEHKAEVISETYKKIMSESNRTGEK